MISVIIPCCIKHIIYIENLLNIYNKQTLLPNEIIIVISEYDDKYNELINKFNNYNYEIKIIKIYEISFASNNRYIGTNASKNNIIIFQDADDIPHIQRLEIIYNIFNLNPNIIHICHKYTNEENILNNLYDLNNIKYKKVKTNALFIMKQVRKITHITNGNIAIKKNICNKINWYNTLQRGQDIYMNNDIYLKFRSSIYIEIPLLLYRIELSSNK